jgi:hypothetical protein
MERLKYRSIELVKNTFAAAIARFGKEVAILDYPSLPLLGDVQHSYKRQVGEVNERKKI